MKLMLFRMRDIADAEAIIRHQEEKLDRSYVRKWLVEMFGAGDPRVARWDEMVAQT